MQRVVALMVVYAGCSFRVDGLPARGAEDLAVADLATVGDISVAGGGDLAVADMAGCQYALCEDWEEGTLLPRWMQNQQNGTVLVDSTRPHRGSYSLHCHANQQTANNKISAYVQEQVTFPQLQAGLFVRAYVYVPSPQPASPEEIFELNQGTTGGTQVALNGPSSFQFYQWGAAPNISGNSTTAMPTDRWVCVEWQMLSSDTRTWFDGTELTDLHFTTVNNWSFDRLWVGTFFYMTSNQPAYDIWIDDVIVDGARIGCN